MNRSLNPDGILQLGMAHAASKALLSAVELGVFTELAHGAQDCNTLRSHLGLHPRGARDFFDTLVALRMLERREGQYFNTPETDLFLDRSKPSYIGGLLELTNDRIYNHWGLLTTALRTGELQNEATDTTDVYAAIYSDSDRLENFLKGMTGISLGVAKMIAEKFPWDEYRSVVDVGAAEGALPVALALKHEHLQVMGFDLPAVAPFFDRYVAAHNLSNRITFMPGDFFKQPLPKADVVVLGHVLHNWNIEEKKWLLNKAYEALTDEGALIVYESLIDDERQHNVQGLIFSLTMLLETPGGFDFTGAECVSWMKEAGFREMRVEHLVGPESMVVGIK